MKKGYDVPVASGKSVATGSSTFTGLINSLQRGAGAIGVGAVVLYFVGCVELYESPREDFRACKMSISSHMALGESKEGHICLNGGLPFTTRSASGSCGVNVLDDIL